MIFKYQVCSKGEVLENFTHLSQSFQIPLYLYPLGRRSRGCSTTSCINSQKNAKRSILPSTQTHQDPPPGTTCINQDWCLHFLTEQPPPHATLIRSNFISDQDLHMGVGGAGIELFEAPLQQGCFCPGIKLRQSIPQEPLTLSLLPDHREKRMQGRNHTHAHGPVQPAGVSPINAVSLHCGRGLNL